MKYILAILGLSALLACTNQNELGYDGQGGNLGYGQAANSQNGYGQNGYGTIGQTGGGSPGFSYLTENVEDTILFPVDQSTITESARMILNKQANWLRTNNFAITVEGHADEQGTREYNLALGARRAAATRDYLISQGVDASRIQVITYGKERPIEVCSSESCWSKNRRSTTVLR